VELLPGKNIQVILFLGKSTLVKYRVTAEGGGAYNYSTGITYMLIEDFSDQ
jgi:hypothetical protein